ncbi:VWA domain-containing protein [Bacillus sp. 3103sda1]|uniref:vWA domain-containing protein n=1 Tax=Bacillus sp. 3103sda1 TaxID=2953808 RepID=UPI00209F2B8B|nr:vWA domain-containing protein [Bacillus sp. 3103sda1]MCP1124389.1 VWA domain-containing protein [Bacillus sp. 3103sda1]
MHIRIIATSILFLLLICICPFSSLAKGEEARQRVVSLVYDDSGSMRNNDRWKYANYALQSLIALLDEKDTFSYVPMSHPSQEITVSLANNKRQEEIEKIQTWNEHVNTPFQSVETAMQSIKRQTQENANREFWLIILTDGAFNELEKQDDSGKKRISETLSTFKKEMEAKNISLHAVLITMEENLGAQEQAQMNVFKDIWKHQINGIVFPTSGEDGVIHSVNQAAALIANRDPFSSVEEAVKTNIVGNKIEVKTPFPLKRITLVGQSSQNIPYRVQNIQGSLNLQSRFSIQAPAGMGLYGGITHIMSKNNAVMEPGTYMVEIDQAVTKENMKVLVEPALDYTVSIYEKGKDPKKETEQIYENQTAIIEAKPTNVPVDASYFNAQIEINGQMYSMQWDGKRKVFYYETKIGRDAVHGNVHMNIKGFYRQTKEFRIQSVPKPKLSLKVVTTNYKEKVTNLEHSAPFIIQPLLNEESMSEAEVRELLKTVTITFHKSINYELKQNRNQIYVYPRPYYSNTFNFTDTGIIEATITLRDSQSHKVSKQISLSIIDVPFLERYATIFQFVLPFSIILFIITILIVGWIVRPRFHRKALMYYEWDQSIAEDWLYKSEPEPLRTKWWNHYFGIPFRAERKTVQSVTFIAKNGSKSIFVTKDSQVPGMVIDGMVLTDEEAGREYKTLYPNEMVVIDRGYGKEVYRYECE